MSASMPAPSAPAIETSDLRKVFGQPPTEKVAVAGLTLRVERGEVFGFLGPNGAGKTTSIKMLLGLIRPTSGSAHILGLPPSEPRSRAKVGFLPEHFRFHDWLTGAEFLTLHGSLYGLNGTALSSRCKELVERVGLSGHEGRPLRTYSKGMLQRIGLAQVLLSHPELVFLDEPTSGLDPVGRRMVRDVIRELRAEGVTVFLNSHLLSEVEITCDRVAFIKYGQVLRIDRLDELTQGGLQVNLRGGPWTPSTLAGLGQWCQSIEVTGSEVSVAASTEADLPHIIRYLTAQGVDLYAVQPKRVSLEELFLEVVGTDGGL